MKVFTPEFNLPHSGKYIWDWYTDLSQRVSRIRDGVCYLIPLSEMLSWAKISRNIVYSWEYDILMEMDAAFCRETNLELQSKREKEEEERQKKLKNR